MAFDRTALRDSHRLVEFNIRSSTQISSRASAIISNLGEKPVDDNKPIIIALTAKAKTASKLISIAEIAKRHLQSKGVKTFQYNALGSENIEIERNPRPRIGQDADDDDSDEAFETMGASPATGLSEKKKRNVPTLTVFLTTSSVRELKSAFSEQKSP